MPWLRKLALYVLVIGLFSAGIVFLLHTGSTRYPQAVSASSPGLAAPAAPATGVGGLLKVLQEPLALLLLQVVVIVVAARLAGGAFAHFGQPPVVGEMLAGILLGPSFFGLVAPAAHAALFPDGSMGALRMLSQIGVITFMFVVGIDLDVSHLRHRSQAAVWVSHASIIVPFALGTAFALYTYRELAPQGVAFNAFALFLGIAMSITAFPVLARILDDRGIARTLLGSTAIACAAVDDVTAWCLLALVVAIAKAGEIAGALVTVALSAAFVVLMLGAVRPVLARLIRAYSGGENRIRAMLAGTLSLVFLCALATEAIGIHALFGAFVAGLVMPAVPSVREELKTRLESFSAVLLLPLFFAFTGLRTSVGLIDDARGLLLCGGLVAVATAGKLGGSMLAARVTGLSWNDSFALGALMNTRGLVELIVLNLGYDLGILSARAFAMMVLMALATTFATGPLLDLAERWRRRHAGGDLAGATPRLR